ncbi:YcjF family protein [Vannielia litorea]|uniref:YcjF family protein n=1 Tax=Vannielia litorea TaxID=1217970 RepID=UPI001C9406AA|nr:TIGR01620 family protein [Vannielia litorea]MBY6048020.1 YcjF family protein [Vannielia litorea]MBY6075434.1 YcjF family protein [Vannielia litorea]
MSEKSGPLVFEVEDDAPGPDKAPPVPEVAQGPAAMQRLAVRSARPGSRIARLFWAGLAGVVSLVVSVAAWDFVMRLLERSPVLGWVATVLIAVTLLALAVMALRELAAFARLARLDGLQKAAAGALVSGDLGAARGVVDRLERLYATRDDTRWGRERLAERRGDAFDADALLSLAERELLVPLDAAAQAEVEAAARQVATVTAVVPLALADVFTALTSNMRMIRRIAEVYGGRAGVLGSWRLTRTVLAHLVATGAVAVGDDLIGSVAGGGVLSKLSRRFGEGVINGALTARVGVAAMEVCRPLPFGEGRRPSVTGLVSRALTGLFGRSEAGREDG